MPITAMTLTGHRSAVSVLHKLGYAHIPDVSTHMSNTEHTWQTIDAKSFTDEELSNGSTDMSSIWRTAEFQECFNASREELINRYQALIPELRQKIMREVYNTVANGRTWVKRCLCCARCEGPPTCHLQDHMGKGSWHCMARTRYDLEDVLEHFARKMEWQRDQGGAIVLRYIDFDYQLIYEHYLVLLQQLQRSAMRPVVMPPLMRGVNFTKGSWQFDGSAICSVCSEDTVAYLDIQITYVEAMCNNIKIQGRNIIKKHLDAYHVWNGDVQTATNLSSRRFSCSRFCIWAYDGMDPERMGLGSKRAAA